MKINGKVHLFFEQSGVFKNEFIKLGISAEDYDLQDNFGQTDHKIDLFSEIEKAYEGVESIFDNITKDDIIMAFFPCIYFCQMSQYAQSLNYINYRSLTMTDAIEKIIERQEKRQQYLSILTKFVKICVERDLRMIFENPITGSFLNNYFLKTPTIKDNNRMKRGDYYKKPTGYWFWNCEPTYGETIQKDKKQKKHNEAESRWNAQCGTCNEERSMISPDYARNFICDFILGKEQQHSQLILFKDDN